MNHDLYQDLKKPSKQESKPTPKRANSERRNYTPYNLNDYKQKVSQPLKISGGLGSNVGSEEWQKRNERALAMK